MLMARLGSVCTISRAHRSRRSQSSDAVALNRSTSRPRTASASGWNASAGASTMKKWYSARLARLQDRRRNCIRRIHCDAFERKVDLEHAAERLRFVDTDLGPDKRMLAGLQDHALAGADRLVARIARDVDEADGDTRLRRLLREQQLAKPRNQKDGEQSTHQKRATN